MNGIQHRYAVQQYHIWVLIRVCCLLRKSLLLFMFLLIFEKLTVEKNILTQLTARLSVLYFSNQIAGKLSFCRKSHLLVRIFGVFSIRHTAIQHWYCLVIIGGQKEQVTLMLRPKKVCCLLRFARVYCIILLYNKVLLFDYYYGNNIGFKRAHDASNCRGQGFRCRCKAVNWCPLVQDRDQVHAVCFSKRGLAFPFLRRNFIFASFTIFICLSLVDS